MVKWLVWFPLSLLRWALCLTGVCALALTTMVAKPVVHPPELLSIGATARTVDRSTLPPLAYFVARDGTELAYRHYPARSQPTGKIAILVHGSSGSSTAAHALADALAGHGVETYAPDVRGHGASGTRGDVVYVGQLEDDLADLVALVRKTSPSEPLTLLGHSAGGGFALRVASSPIQNLFARSVLLAPFLGYDAPTTRPDAGGWASPDVPRILGLMALRKLGIDCCEALPVLAFAVPPNSEKILVATYTERLRRNFAASPDFRRDLAAVTKPMTIFAGAEDELMLAGKYADAVNGAAVPIDVKLIAGIDHMGIVSTARAVSAVADDVATRGTAGS
jgi:alpha-beta hydrolase superfamily lysophospholipase